MKVYNFEFDQSVVIKEAEDSLMLAMLAVEGLHGRTALISDAQFKFDSHKRTCSIDVSTSVGSDLARIFTIFVHKEFGERAVKTKCVPNREDGKG